MSMLAQINLGCEDERHVISVLEPGDETLCEEGHLLYGVDRYIICYQNHDIDLDRTIADLTGHMPWCLEYSIGTNQTNVIKSIQRYGGSINGIILAVCLGADIHTGDNFALRFAVRHGNLSLVKMLVKMGVNVHTQHDYVISLATSYGHQDIVEYLKKKLAEEQRGTP